MRLVYITAAALCAALLGCTPRPLEELNAQHPGPNEVLIYDYKYFPPTLTVPVGTMVTWKNKDIAPHTVTHRSYTAEEAFDSESMGHLALFTHRFQAAGSFAYLCVYHQGMQGTVVVQ